MFAKLWGYAAYRKFSKSAVWRDLAKKPTDSPVQAESSNSSSSGFQMSRMPTPFEKKILVYSGRFKTMEDVPKLVTSEMLDKAKSKIRIKIANLMILATFIICAGVIYEGKSLRKERHKKWKEEQDAKFAEYAQLDPKLDAPQAN